MDKQNQPPERQTQNVLADNPNDKQPLPTTEASRVYSYRFGITFRTRADFAGFMEIVVKEFSNLHVEQTNVVVNGERVGVEFTAIGPEALLHTLREQLNSRHRGGGLFECPNFTAT